MEGNRGVALILALLVLSFLTVLGGALLTTSTIDIWISDNYKTATQNLYLAEAGIDDGREMLRTSDRTLTQLLNAAAGPDLQLATEDDEPFIPARQLIDASGRSIGSYEVWLRNDSADGVESLFDSNEVLTLASVARIGTTEKALEVTVQKGKFPEAPDDSRLGTTAGLEDLVSSITGNATDVYGGSAMGDFGAPNNYRVVVVDGSIDLGPGIGYGILLVRGDLHIVRNATWNGLVLVIGNGVVRSDPGMSLAVSGGLFVARTLALDGSRLVAPVGVTYNITETGELRKANRSFPYNPIAIMER